MEMPTISSSTSSSSSNPSYTLIKVDDDDRTSKKYDVFINFRGEDTRKNILGHLRSALSEKGFNTFVDDEQLARGQQISPQLLQAIEDSSCSVVIISQNYASSSWCLDELVHILDCMKTGAQIVIPVFYHVDPSDVRKQVGSFGEAFAKHEKNFEDDLERVNGWRVALREVTSLVGLDLKNYRDEVNFIREIVGEVSSKLTSLASSKVPEDGEFSNALEIVCGISRTILFILFFFLVIFPLFGLFFFKVVVPITEHITGIGDTPFPDSWNEIKPECPEGMVPSSSSLYKNLFPDTNEGKGWVCVGQAETPMSHGQAETPMSPY